MKMKMIILVLSAVAILLQSGCVEKTAGTGGETMQIQKSTQPVPVGEEEAAYDIFKQILELSESNDRQKNLPRIKELYRDIIDAYPETGLAQESYLRLIIIAREGRTASGDVEAERLYQEFLEKYPDSNLKKILEYEAGISN